MVRRQSKPALLELFTPPSPPDDASAGSPSTEGRSSWISPGRSLRITPGHLLLALAGAIILVVITWMIAFQQGELHTRKELESVIFHPVETDPALDESAVELGTPDAGMGNQLQETSPEGLLVGDPRQPGFSYFILAETRQDGAVRLAAYCRSKGLETWVIPRETTGLARVVALPGLTSTMRSDEAFQSLDLRIGAIGRQWKQQGGQSSLEDRYLVRWDG